LSARRINFLDFFDLKKLGIVLKRAQYFITCKGKYYGSVSFDNQKIKDALMPKIDLNLVDESSEQLSFFDNKINLNNKSLLLDDKISSSIGEF